MRPFRAILTLCAALAACSGEGGSSRRRLPDDRLPTLAGSPPALSSCPTDRCVTVLVAPWCSVCRAESGNIVQFRRFLDAQGVSSRVVVGLSDDLAEIKGFAAEFGADTLLDAGQTLQSRGVPTFFVSDREGRVLKAVNGYPRTDGPDALARYLGLI